MQLSEDIKVIAGSETAFTYVSENFKSNLLYILVAPMLKFVAYNFRLLPHSAAARYIGDVYQFAL